MADGDKHDDYMKFAFQLVLQQKNILLVDKCWPSVTSFCQIATATETHKAKKWPLCLFCESFLSVQGRCSRALEGGAFCRDVVNLNFPKSRFRCTWALHKLSNHPDPAPSVLNISNPGFPSRNPSLEVFFNAKVTLRPDHCCFTQNKTKNCLQCWLDSANIYKLPDLSNIYQI